MTPETEKPRGRTVERKLRLAWKRERRFYRMHGVCHLLLWAGALILVDFLVDWLFLLPGYGRVILLAINLATLGAVFYRSWWRHLRPYDPVRIALQVERRHPDLKSLLVSYIQFGPPGRAMEYMSPQLIAASRRLAIAATEPIDFREIINWRDITRVSLFSAAVVLFCGALSLNWPEFFGTLFYRLINPAASVAYPTRTQIVEVTGPVTVPQGAGVAIQARCTGLVPATGKLMMRPQGGDWEPIGMPQTDQRKFEYRFEQVLRGFTYRVRLGDAASDSYEVRVIPAPHVVKTRVRLHFPPYTRLPDKEVDSLHLEVPEGTDVTASLECDRPLAAAATVAEDGAATAMQVDGDGRTATIHWTVKESFPFHFRWTGREHNFIYEGDVTYFIRVVPDSPPDIEITSPTEDDKATVEKRLAIRYRAADDYGIAKAEIVYSLNGEPETRRPAGTFDRTPVEDQVAWKLKESIPGIKEGDTLVFAIEVADNRAGEGGPNVTRSRPLRLDIVSVAEYLRYILEKRERLIKEIQAMHESETDASKEVKTLREEPLPLPQAPPATPQEENK